VQVPEQHWDADEQLWPTDAHAPLAHFPPVQVRLQQSALPEQVAPAAAQNSDELHLCVVALQAVEQQSAFAAQLSPPGWHAFATGVVQVPLAHCPEQQSLAVEQVVPPERHWPAGSTHRFDAQALVQQSALDPQT
jgi:hypothetical protein